MNQRGGKWVFIYAWIWTVINMFIIHTLSGALMCRLYQRYLMQCVNGLQQKSIISLAKKSVEQKADKKTKPIAMETSNKSITIVYSTTRSSDEVCMISCKEFCGWSIHQEHSGLLFCLEFAHSLSEDNWTSWRGLVRMWPWRHAELGNYRQMCTQIVHVIYVEVA